MAIVAVLFIGAAALFGLTNEEVIKMAASGLSEETILLAVNNAKEPAFDTSVDAMIALKTAGLSEQVIQAMIVRTTPAGETGPAAAVVDGPVRMEFKDVPSDRVMPPPIQPQAGSTYFTRVNFWYERGQSSATNYTRGYLVPVNTEVTLVAVGKDAFTLRTADGESVKIVNVPGYTRASITELLTRYLADRQTRIDLYGEAVAAQIRTGTPRIGMTKDQVLLTRGYPPFHETPGLDADRWVYWSSRFVKQTLAFHNGRLEEGRGLN
jgi:hypothetical protein